MKSHDSGHGRARDRPGHRGSPPGAAGEQLRQAYLTPSGAPVEFRVRAGGNARLMTAKTFYRDAGAMIRQEVEFPIADAVFEQLWELARGECLSKFRWPSRSANMWRRSTSTTALWPDCAGSRGVPRY